MAHNVFLPKGVRGHYKSVLFLVCNTYGFVYQYLRICLLKPTDLFTNSYVFVYLAVDN